MKHPPLHSIAQPIVDAITPLVGDRTINIMDPNGTIVASSDPSRIGTFHQGAAIAASTRSIVRIRPEDVSRYTGAKEGINLPLVKNGELLGVVGIYGVPDEVEQAANLLGVCVDLYLDQALANRRIQLRKDMHQDVFRHMLLGELINRDELLSAGQEAQLDLGLPVRVIAVRAASSARGREYSIDTLNRLYDALNRDEWIDGRRDVLAIGENAISLVKRIQPGFDVERFCRDMHESVNAMLGVPVTVALGSLCTDWRTVVLSHHEAQVLAEMGGGFLSTDTGQGKVMYTLTACLRTGMTSRYLETIMTGLRRGFDLDEMPRVMESMRIYAEAGCRCGTAAERIGVHKNTMNYRINKILSLTGLDKEDLFTRELFLRLLVMQYDLADNT